MNNLKRSQNVILPELRALFKAKPALTKIAFYLNEDVDEEAN